MMTWGIDPPALAFALAQALLRASVAGGIAAALVWTVCRLRPALPPAVRAALWWLVCAKFLLGLWPQPVGLPVLPADASPRVAAAGAAATSGVPPGEAAADATAADAAHAGRGTGSTGATEVGLRTAELARLPLPFMPLMAALARAGDTMAHVSLTTVGAAATVLLWVGALVLITRRSARRWRALRALADEARPVPAGTRAQLDDVAAQLGVALPLLASSPRVASPLLMWWRRTRVLLPEAALTSWPIRHRDAAVAHELVHIRRGDLWWGLVPSLAERLFFFHPLARLAASEYAVARESACDVEVVTGLALPTPEYGRLLIQLGIRSGSGLAVAGAPSSLTALKRRLTMLSHLPSNRRPPRWVWALVGCAALATLPFTLVARAEGCEGWGQVCDSTFAQNAPGHSEPCAIADLTPPPPPPPPAAAPQTPPPAPPAPPAPPPPPPPPPPAPPAKSGDSWALVGDGPTYVAGDGEGLARAREHAKGGTPVLWFRRDGREYIVRDPELLGRVRSVLSERMSGIEGDELTRLARELSDEMK
ncbi:MAG: hypothetical protein KJ061_10155, partial [Vicinamibacteraceae bacterium]|nr:hypothetical protein [Vicinamibacteraceae bacterium]